MHPISVSIALQVDYKDLGKRPDIEFFESLPMLLAPLAIPKIMITKLFRREEEVDAVGQLYVKSFKRFVEFNLQAFREPDQYATFDLGEITKQLHSTNNVAGFHKKQFHGYSKYYSPLKYWKILIKRTEPLLLPQSNNISRDNMEVSILNEN